MVIYTGGTGQGQKELAVQEFHLKSEEVLDGALCRMEELAGARAILDFHLFLRRAIKWESDPAVMAEKIIVSCPQLVIVTDEIGSGIVPLENEERAWREYTGRVCCILAEHARQVTRVVCGIPFRLKGEMQPVKRLIITLIRHGQTAGNLTSNYIGRTDEPLCGEGRIMLSEKKVPPADLWAVSPMKRTVESARILSGTSLTHAAAHDDPHPLFTLVPDLRECDFGKFENKNYQELSGDPEYQEWIKSNGMGPFPGGEVPEEFFERCCRAFDETVDFALSLCRREVCRINMVVHGGTIMSIMQGRVQEKNGEKKPFYSWGVPCGEGYVIEGRQRGDHYDYILDRRSSFCD